MITALRLGIVLLALGAAFVLDDPAEDSTAHLPTPRWMRRAMRIALASPVIGEAFLVSLPIAVRSAERGSHLPARALGLELAAIVATSLALSALVRPSCLSDWGAWPPARSCLVPSPCYSCSRPA